MSAIRASNISAAAKKANLERIRNNQRRCRARQKSYIAELEEKIRQYESTYSQSSTDPKLQQLMGENESLKRLLKSLGLGDDFLKAYSKANQLAPEISRAQLGDESCCLGKGCSSSSPSLKLTPAINYELQDQVPPLSLSTDTNALNPNSLQFIKSPIEQEDSVLLWDPFDFPSSNFVSESLQLKTQPQSPVQLNGDSLMIEALRSSMQEGVMSDTTTLCSLAFSLVLKNNIKGCGISELDFKLRVGYREGTTISEGCRIDNKVLFNVLAEIS